MFCSQCGSEAPAGAKFCSGCGRALSAGPPATVTAVPGPPPAATAGVPRPNGATLAPPSPAPAAAPAIVPPLPLPTPVAPAPPPTPPSPAPPPAPAPAFRPTHRAPVGGIRTWPVADPAAPPGPEIDAGVEVSILERQGDWTRVVCANGWSAWVDGRDLQPLPPHRPATAAAPPAAPARAAPAPPAPARAAPAPAPQGKALRLSPAPFVGAGLIAVGALLGWVRGLGRATSSLDLPLLSLIDFKASRSAVKLGFLVLALAGAGIAGALQPSRAWLKRVAGIGAVVVTVLFVVQLQRALQLMPGVNLTKTVGPGIPLTLAGGLALLFEDKVAGLFNRSRRGPVR